MKKGIKGRNHDIYNIIPLSFVKILWEVGFRVMLLNFRDSGRVLGILVFLLGRLGENGKGDGNGRWGKNEGEKG